MKKSVIFLINGLGIEKAGSYSISIDQCMPNLAKVKETSFFTTAVINSLEFRSAYRYFFLGDTYRLELNYIKERIINEQVQTNPVFRSLLTNLVGNKAKLHIFVEPNNDKIVEAINDLVNKLNLDKDREVYLHLILSQQSCNEYNKIISIVNNIKYRSGEQITVGFVIGKEYLSSNFSNDEMNFMKKMLFSCSVERWIETEKKFMSLQQENVRPCEVKGFTATNKCNIENNDVIMFFNTNRNNYDNILGVIYNNALEMFKVENFNLPTYSLVSLDTKYDIKPFSTNIVYENSLANILEEADKRSLIVTKQENISLVNFLANGQNYVNNPRIQFMQFDYAKFNNQAVIENIINNSQYDLIIFDYHMEVDKTINDLKMGLEEVDKILGLVAASCENKNSLFITSLYGIKKSLPLADYNSEKVTIDYEMQIPIFFFDYSYIRSKYALLPGETNDILNTAISCIYTNNKYYSLIREKGLFNKFFRKK